MTLPYLHDIQTFDWRDLVKDNMRECGCCKHKFYANKFDVPEYKEEWWCDELRYCSLCLNADEQHNRRFDKAYKLLSEFSDIDGCNYESFLDNICDEDPWLEHASLDNEHITVYDD
jgi:hypothetical protein